MKTSLLRTDSRWFNVDWKIILKRKLSNSEYAMIISVLARDLQEEGIILERVGVQPSEFVIGEDAIRFPRNVKVTLEGHSSIFALDFSYPNMDIIINHINGDEELTVMIEEYLSTEQDLINRMIRAISKDTTGDVAFG